MTYAAANINHATEDAIHCDAYNAAFYELGLRWHWNLDTYRRLQPDADGMKERVQAYLEAEQPHILKAYNPDFLAKVIVEAKERCLASRKERGTAMPPMVNWAAFQATEIGV